MVSQYNLFESEVVTKMAPLAIIGPGALGTLFALRFSLAGIPVFLQDYRCERAEQLNGCEFQLLEKSQRRRLRLTVTADTDLLSQACAALVLVKSYRTDDVAALLAEHLPAEAGVLTLQNGLGNVETLQLHLGANRVLGGVTSQGALLESTSVVRDNGSGATIIGSLDGSETRYIEQFSKLLLQAGFSLSVTNDLPVVIWEKVLLNVAINPLGALLGRRNGQLIEDKSILQLMTDLIAEANQVAIAEGVRIPACDWTSRLRTICQATAENRNSMLQDIRAGRMTEIDSINGAIVRIAERHSLPVIRNQLLVTLIRGLIHDR